MKPEFADIIDEFKQKITAKELLSILKKMFRKMKKEYRHIVIIGPENQSQQIIYDNFYLIVKNIKILSTCNSNVLYNVDMNNNPLLGQLIFSDINGRYFGLVEELCNDINKIQKKIYISNNEFENLIWQTRYTIIKNLFTDYLTVDNTDKMLDYLVLLTKCDTIDTDTITDKCNPVELIYKKEKCNIYSSMDSMTKFIYRDYTTQIAKKKGLSEDMLAEAYLIQANEAIKLNKPEKNCHVGYYIYKDYDRLFSFISPKNYIINIIVLTVILTVLTGGLLQSYWLWILTVVPVYYVSKTLIDIIFQKGHKISYLPRIDLKGKIPDNAKTMITVTTILTSPEDIKELEEKLVRIYFSELNDNISICALCDFKEANMPSVADDNIIIRELDKMISKINRKYCNVFTSILRKRCYVKTQNNYSGYERKRGAIVELVKYIKGENILFCHTCGNIDNIKSLNYLIVLDYDTKLLLGTASQLISVACHVLNKPVILNGKIKSGYGVITPKVTSTLKSSLYTPFSKFVGGIGSSSAYDLYCCDLYQDFFNEGIFTGKGLIDINAFYTLCCDYFPEEKILSHDILEGALLRTGFAGDIEIRDNFPAKSLSYFKRNNRWLRGDTQNIPYIFSKVPVKDKPTDKEKTKFSLINRFKLIDNFRKPLAYITIYHLLFITIFLGKGIGTALCILALFCLLLPYLISLFYSLLYCGVKSIYRKYYSGALSQTKETLYQILMEFLLLPVNFYVCSDAILRSLYRMIFTNKNLLQWSTSSQTEKKNDKDSFYYLSIIIPEIASIALLFSGSILVKIIGAIFIFTPLITHFMDRPYKSTNEYISYDKKQRLKSDLERMWNYYQDYATESEHYLPPDNVQTAPIFRICHRTSPTNIGLMLVSTLIARDFKLIDTQQLYNKIYNSINTIKKLEKIGGNLYNWYETKTLELSTNPFVSSVDSGNFLCCLIVLKEGLKEYNNENIDFSILINDIQTLIDNTDLYMFYNEKSDLFSIGYNPSEKTLSENHYDMLMSEARMTSYFAIAKRIVPKKHWYKLSRMLACNGLYSGPVSYSGTMFEYFMPELMLMSENGSLSYEALKYCIYCQKQRGNYGKVPFGISESGYYAFDNNLNYQYKAHGVSYAGLKQGLDDDLVISPYSTYLSMTYDFAPSYNNLKELNKYGLYGKYGFYEAIDFTKSRCPSNGCIVKSYMAHHIGMSILSISNILDNHRIQKLFQNDEYMKSADELLEEKIISGAIKYDELNRKSQNVIADNENDQVLLIDKVYPENPKMKLLFNGEYTLVLSDIGASFAIYQEKDVYKRTTDVLRRPQGCFFAVKTDNKTIPFTYLPEYKDSDNNCIEFQNDTVSYFCEQDSLELGMKVHLHAHLPCEIRQFAIKNNSNKNKSINLLSYIEPTLMSEKDYMAHPAFNKLFLKEIYDTKSKCIIISRKNRHNDEGLYCAIGFIEDINYTCCLSREDILSRPYGVKGLFKNNNHVINTLQYIPDPAVMINTSIDLKSGEQKELNLFIMTSLDKEELFNSVNNIRCETKIQTISTSMINSSSLEGILVSTILPEIMMNVKGSRHIDNAIESNNSDINSLWSLGISGDNPVLCVDILSLNCDDRLAGYIKCHSILKLCGIKPDLVFIYDDKSKNENLVKDYILHWINKLNKTNELNAFAGIHIIDRANTEDNIMTMLTAYCLHYAGRSMIKIGSVYPEFSPLDILPVNKVEKHPDVELIDGGFTEDKFIITQKTKLPWSHILANPSFGTMLSDSALGFTYAINCRENKLTPWFNDTMTDNRGEMLLLKTSDNLCYDLILGSTAEFSSSQSVYYGECELFESTIKVTVPSKGMTKNISIFILWKTQPQEISIAYYTEPVLGVTRENSRMIKFSYISENFIAQNPLNKDISGFMSMTSSERINYHTTNRQDFLSGKWNENNISSSNYPCMAMIKNINMIKNKSFSFSYNLSFARTLSSVIKMPDISMFIPVSYKNKITINTPDKNLNHIFNNWLYWQALAGRLYARTGFYQNSGAYGFRDQLQDSCGILLIEPDKTKQQIAKACSSQFPEGDVLHWWHRLPDNIKRGVRTKYSDDLVWLPYTVSEYVEKTNDITFLNKKISYCTGSVIPEGEHEIYSQVSLTDYKESIYSHCKKALERAYRIGEHGLILMGCGDWNDSFNGVGIGGKGESVWLSQFMILVYNKFSVVSKLMNDNACADEYLLKAHQLSIAIEDNCWDGEWYLRAFFDDGTELGSKNCEACQIDSLAQSFASLCNLPNKEKVSIALSSAYSSLIDKNTGLIKLFTPPFRKDEMPVGYATSYPAGIRENGGQYTHGAIWLAIAFLNEGYYDKGNELIKILNPANKYLNANKAQVFKNEPYYMTADIYTNPQCYGRGGWSIYTGAASWYYRAIFEWFLGLKINYGKLSFKPNIPKDWDEYQVNLEYNNTTFNISVVKGQKNGIFDNDIETEYCKFDGKKHEIRIVVARD